MAEIRSGIGSMPKFDKYPPELFDSITLPEGLGTKAVTLPQLITQLTAPNILDYSFLADFFLSFRNFTTADEVVELLFSRLTWALVQYQSAGTENERDVIVRTFVVLRHWILNFFADDFLVNSALRDRFVGDLNCLYDWPLCAKDETIKRVFGQLKRCWSRECAIYWNMSEIRDDETRLEPGGFFAVVKCADLDHRRMSVLQMYDGPIDPVLTKPPVDMKTAGKLIRGGIMLSNDVEVKSVAQSVKVDRQRQVRKKKSMKDMVKERGGFFTAMTNALRKKPVVPEEKVTEHKGEKEVVRIDILSARVIEELDRILKRQSMIKHGYEQWDHRESESTSSRNSIATTITTTHTSSVELSFEGNSMTQWNASQPTPKWTDSVASIKMPKRDRKKSMIDNLGVQGMTPLKRTNPAAELGTTTNTTKGEDRESWGDFSQEFDRVSNFSGTLSLSTNRESYMSYDSDLSACQSVCKVTVQSEDYDGGVRKRENVDNLRGVARLGAGGRKSFMSVASVSTANTAGTTQHHAAMVANGGVDPEIAAKLAAIPDESLNENENAIDAALKKLEGTYNTSTAPSSSREEQVDSQLYNEAFESPPDLEELDIPQGIEPGDEEERRASVSTVTGTDKEIPETPRPKRQQQHVRTISRVPEPHEPLSVQSTIRQGNHVPFVLDYSSKLLAEQFTLIEKDALAQVDWKELIELKWSGRLEPIQSWLAFLVERNVRGVEVVISRFNLMVNWVKSEVLLTWSMEERVCAISRFIHIAYQARLLQNYSTVMQMMLALASPMIQKMKETWRKLPVEDYNLYKTLEQLMSPTNNFKALRTELGKMDGAKGCIPFVGIYLSDLTNNSQLDSFDKDGLINYVKYETAASIVKGLIQCIQWSANYDKHLSTEHQDLLSKCLYVHSLTQEEMENCNEHLE